MKNIAVLGATGWVGSSMMSLFPNAYKYTRTIGNKEEVNRRHIAFVCVPSPIVGEKELDTSFVEEIVKWCECSLIVIRSTVNPGDCERWEKKYNKNIVYQPEYLGETPEHPLLNEKKTPFIILGGREQNRRKLIELYTKVYNANITIRQVSLYEAEVIKLSENRAIAYKVAQCQELYDACENAGIDYYKIRDAVYGDDPRFNLWWTFIYPDKRGFNSKCIPKDVYAWAAWAESTGADTKVIRKLLERNKELINAR